MRFYKIVVSNSDNSNNAPSATSGAATPDVTTPTTPVATNSGGIGSDANIPLSSTGAAGSGVSTVNTSAAVAPASPKNTASNAVASGTSSGALLTFTSLVNGINDPGALDVEFDVNMTQGQTGANWVKIRGIDPKLISQAQNYNNKRLQMWVGYSSGLPLANEQVPHQGLVLDGQIWPCFGNWIFNELSLEFFVVPGDTKGLGGPVNPKNIVHNMPANQPLSTALKNTLSVAFPKANIIMNISDKLKLPYPDYGIYQSIEQLGDYIKGLSHSILGTPPDYKGVTITANGNNIHVNDGTKSPGAIKINYDDLVGQPTWIGPKTLQVTTLMRGDINIPNNTTITLPETQVTQTAASAVLQKGNTLNFSGDWTVTSVRHVGKYRSPQYDNWVTIIEATQGGSGSGGSGGTSDPSTDPATTNPGGINPDGTPATTAPTGPNAGPNSTFITQTPLTGAGGTGATFDPITGQPTAGGVGTFSSSINTGGQQTFTPLQLPGATAATGVGGSFSTNFGVGTQSGNLPPRYLMALDQITLLYQVSPIILTGGLASNISGGMLPMLALTNPNAFTSNLLNGAEDFSLDDAFGIFQPAAGGTLVEQIIAQYPFANLSVAANAIIRNPINVSMLMLTPMKEVGSWALKQQMMSSLKSTLDSHNNAGGTYTVCTPAFIYTDMLMLGVIDVSTAASPIPQNAWRWDFTKPLVSLADATGAMNNLMNQINNGTAPAGGGGGAGGAPGASGAGTPDFTNIPDDTFDTPSTSSPGTAIGQQSSIVNTGPGAGATSPWISQTPLTSFSTNLPQQNQFFPDNPTGTPVGTDYVAGGEK
jgi:hypothetical protein